MVRIYDSTADADVPHTGDGCGNPWQTGGSARLAVQTGDHAEVDYPLSAPSISIGRSARTGNDIVLESDALCSKRHAVIEREKDRSYTLYDLSSTNGTKVNGIRIQNRSLVHGDRIEIGATLLIFEQVARSPSAMEGEEDAVPPDRGTAWSLLATSHEPANGASSPPRGASEWL